jgi:hypothetical protein
MSVDLLLWILAIICFIIAAVGTFKSHAVLIMFGWIGLALAALTFIAGG